MPESFYTLLTTVGAAQISNAIALGEQVNLTELAVGDGLNGAYYDPDESQTALENEVWRGAINNLEVDANNPNWIIIEAVIPADSPACTVREAGVFDGAGNLIAVGKYPQTYKPNLAQGSGKDLFVRMVLMVSNTAAISLTVDPAVVLATRDYAQGLVTTHANDADAHGSPWSVITKTADYTIPDTDDRVLVRVDSTSGPVTITLPAAANATTGARFVVAKVSADTNAVTVAGAGTDTVNTPATSIATTLQWDVCRLTLDKTATDWVADTAVGLLDEDDMVSNSDTQGATQQSIKTFCETSISTHAADDDAHGASSALTAHAGNADAHGVSEFTKSYTSGETVMTAGGLITVSHGLGGVPKLVQVIAKCVSARAGYAVGDEVIVSNGSTNNTTGYGLAIRVTSSQILVRQGSNAGVLIILNKDTGNVESAGTSNFKLIIKGYR